MNLFRRKPKYRRVGNIEDVIWNNRARVDLFQKQDGDYIPILRKNERLELDYTLMVRIYHDRCQLYRGGK